MPPVVGRKIGAPGLDTLCSEILLYGFGAEQAGNAEERRRGVVLAECRRGRGDAVVDLLLRALNRHPVHAERVILGMGADTMAGIADFADAFRIVACHPADDEE